MPVTGRQKRLVRKLLDDCLMLPCALNGSPLPGWVKIALAAWLGLRHMGTINCVAVKAPGPAAASYRGMGCGTESACQ
jgi:hypothetical protein